MVAVVSGANRGLGLALTRELLSRGYEVHVGVRKVDARSLKELDSEYGGRLHVHRLDVSDPDSIESFARELKGVGVDLLVNNAGVLFKDGLGNLDYEKFLYTIRVNTLGPMFLSNALLENLESKRGKIVNIDSVMGSISLHSGTHSYSYSVSKAALNMVTKVLATDLRGRGITVVSIHPGWVRTDMGGPGAPLLPEDSARGILNVVERLTITDSGKFFDYTGKELPW